MAYAKVTDGAVTRFFDLNNPVSRGIYNELINNNTGYNVVVDQTGNTPKEFSETEVKQQINAARAASAKPVRRNSVPSNKTVADEV